MTVSATIEKNAMPDIWGKGTRDSIIPCVKGRIVGTVLVIDTAVAALRAWPAHGQPNFGVRVAT